MLKHVSMLIVLVFLASTIKAQTVSGTIINDASQVLDGGLSEDFSRRTFGAIAFAYSAKNGLRFYADAQGFRGDNGSESVGDLQAYSNIDENEFTKLYEVWLEKEFDDIGLRIKVGQVDANTEFAFVEHASEFINSSMGLSPSISEIPTYPAPSLSFNAFLQTTASASWALGVYSDDSNEFEDVFSIGQWNKHIQQLDVSLGAWYKSSGVAHIAPGLKQNDNLVGSAEGYYATLGGSLNFSIFDASSAGWFAQLAYTPAKYSAITSHIGGGVQWYGVHGEENNVFGLGFSYAKINKEAELLAPSAEMALEVFYRFQLNKHVALKPDLQYIINPGSNADIDNALVFTLRTEVSF